MSIIGKLLNSLLGVIDENELKRVLSNRPFLVDVRTKGEFEGGSIKEAINIPVNEIEHAYKKLSNKTTIVVFCRSGIRSKQALSVLKQMGIENVINGGSLQNLNRVIQKINNVV
jgi:phage shock protein E